MSPFFAAVLSLVLAGQEGAAPSPAAAPSQARGAVAPAAQLPARLLLRVEQTSGTRPLTVDEYTAETRAREAEAATGRIPPFEPARKQDRVALIETEIVPGEPIRLTLEADSQKIRLKGKVTRVPKSPDRFRVDLEISSSALQSRRTGQDLPFAAQHDLVLDERAYWTGSSLWSRADEKVTSTSLWVSLHPAPPEGEARPEKPAR